VTARRPRARAVATALLLALATALGGSLPPLEPVTAPVARTLPAPVRDALRPLPVVAGTPCSNYSADYPKFTGRLSNSSGTLLTETTTGTVYGRISNVDQSWDLYDCYAYRYDATLWATTNATTNLRVNWGLLAGDGNACRYNVGTTDYLHANSGACPGSETTARLVVSLTPQATYRADVNLDHTGDFAFAHADCSTNYGAEPIKTGASTSVTSGKPGANCGNKALDGTGTSQTLVYDGTAPTISFTFPAAGGPVALASTSAAVTFSATDNVAGFGGTDDWDLTRQTATWNGTACGTFAADTGPKAVVSGTTTGTQVVSQGLAAGACYRWTLGARDQNGNTATTITSGSIRTAPPPAALGLPAWGTVETFDLGAGDRLAVNVGTGNLVVSHPIVTLPIRGGTLELAATYNSADSTNVGMGPGWRLDAFRRLAVNADGSVTFTAGDGSRHTFTNPQGSGIVTYTRPPTLYATLVRDTAATPDRFTLTWRDQSIDVFDEDLSATGLLKQQKDRHGNTVAFAYAAGTARISTITDPAGRSISFTWDGSGRLTQIVDWANVSGGIVQGSGTGNRTHRFLYDASGYLSGWADPLAGGTPACPAGGSHLTCLAYTGGLLSAITRTQTYATFSGSALGTATRPVTASVAYENADVAGVTDAEGAQVTFSHPAAGVTRVARPGTPASQTTYALTAVADPYARIASVKRKLGAAEVEQRTSWSTAFPTEPASVVDNYVNGVVGDGTSPTVDDRTTSYTYGTTSPDTMGRVVTVSEPLDGTNTRVTEYTYNANHDVTLVKVSQNGTTTPVYTKTCYTTQANTCATSETGPSVVRQIENWVSGGPSTHDTNVATDFTSDSFGQRLTATRYNRSSAGALIDARVSAWAYGTSGGALGNVVTETVNVAGSSTYDADPDPATNARTNLRTLHEYDSAGNRIATADPRRAILGAGAGTFDYRTTWTYDAANRQVTEQTPTTPLVTITQKTATTVYDELGAVRSATDFGGRVTATRFDLAGRALATYEDPAGTPPAVQTSAATYDAAGRVLTAKDQRQVAGSGGETQTTYDELGRTTSVKEAVVGGVPLSTTTTGYDRLDRVVSQSVGGADPTTTTYDLGGRAIHVNEGFTCTTTSYDVRDRVTSVIEGRTPGATCTGTGTRTVSQGYDGLGRLTSRTEGTTVLEAFAYDAAGRATKTWSTEGVLERVTERTWNILDEATTEYRYVRDTSTSTLSGQSWGRSNRDPAGSETDRCTWGAQPAEWCKQADQTFANPQPTARSSSRYDARNNRIALYVPGQGETTYDPNANYQPAAFYQPTAAGKEHQTRYTYDERHRLASIAHVLCATAQRPCSGGNVLASVLASEYLYDGNDNRTTVTDNNGSGAVTRHYCYDARNQLVAVSTSSSTCASGVIETYAYDAAGNRTSAAGRSFTYGTSNKLATCSSTACNPVFDADGRLTRVTLASGTWSYQYDADGRLTAACKASSCTTGIARLDFAYDAEGNRTRITETPASGTATVTELTYEGGRVVRETATTGAAVITRAFTADEAGAIVRMTITGDPVTLHNGTYLVTWNGHGDALALERLDPATGTLTGANRFSYSTWGAPTITLHNGYGDLGFRYRYVGQWGVAWDGYAGADLLYMRARHYNPELGRFLQPDPARAEENPYAYASNSPVTKVDPSGLWTYLDRRWIRPAAVGAFLWGAIGAAVCLVATKLPVVAVGCGGVVGASLSAEIERVRVDIFYERSRTLTIAIPFKKPYDRLVQGKGGQVTIYWTPKDAGRKCAEVLAGRRDPYQARLLCGSSVWSVRW
jgi:RHS repeat-associated protein